MKKSVNLYILYPSILLTILITYVMPCRYIEDWKKVFGFPFGWFTVFYDKIGDVILTSTAVDLLPFMANTLIMYLLTSWVNRLYLKRKSA